MSIFKVVVELFEIEESDRYNRHFLNEARNDHKELIRVLRKAKGIYAFYNSEAEIIYVGKTKSSLWNEMRNAFTRKMPHYQRYFVRHPHGRYKRTASGVPRKILRRTPFVWETALYFSAYSVNSRFIDDLERFLIRIAPNDIANRRMEGNTSIEMQDVETEVS